MEFREKYGLDTILTDYKPPEVIKKYLPGGFFGEDREGHPVWYSVSGNTDARGVWITVVCVWERERGGGEREGGKEKENEWVCMCGSLVPSLL